jgi:hypothetical protein
MVRHTRSFLPGAWCIVTFAESLKANKEFLNIVEGVAVLTVFTKTLSNVMCVHVTSCSYLEVENVPSNEK